MGHRRLDSPGGLPVVLLGGHGSTVAVARSLARAGVAVSVLADRSSPARFSRHVEQFVDLGRGPGVTERWLEWLQRRGPERAAVLTCHDDGLELVARNRARLVARGYLPLEADDDLLLAMLDKERTYDLARAVGVPAPRTWRVHSSHDLEAALPELDYPCAFKPRHSHLFVKRFGVKFVVVRNAEEVMAWWQRIAASDVEVLLTEIVPGSDDTSFSYYTYLDENGHPLFDLTKQKLRQYPNGFGLGSYHVTDWRPEVAELGRKLVQGIGLRGMVNPEFKRDPRDGLLKLMEVNHRFTAIDQLLRVAGIDLALLAYSRLAGGPPPPLDGYRKDVRIWFPVHDARAFVQYRRRGELGLTTWLGSLMHRQHLPLFTWDDPLPSLSQLPLTLAKRLRPRVRATRP